MHKDISQLILENAHLREQLIQARAQYLQERKAAIALLSKAYQTKKRILEHRISETTAMIEANVATILLDPQAERLICTDWYYKTNEEMIDSDPRRGEASCSQSEPTDTEAQEQHQKRIGENNH